MSSFRDAQRDFARREGLACAPVPRAGGDRMAAPDPWPTIHAERAALADDLAGLAEQRWDTASLCSEWTVLDVLGHMTATAKMTPTSFFSKLLRSGFQFSGMTRREIARETAQGPG